MSKKKVAILVSGNGSNARNLITNPVLNRLFCFHVISSKENEKLQAFCTQHKVSFTQLTEDSTSRNQKLELTLHQFDAEFIVLAGYLKLIPKQIIQQFQKRIINLHPSLLPKFGGSGMYGRFVHQAVFTSKETQSGITIHYVSEEYDKGEIIMQVAIDIASCKSPLDIEKKIQELEYRYLPETILKIW